MQKNNKKLFFILMNGKAENIKKEFKRLKKFKKGRLQQIFV